MHTLKSRIKNLFTVADLKKAIAEIDPKYDHAPIQCNLENTVCIEHWVPDEDTEFPEYFEIDGQ
ncbi:hypothetical protein EGM51_10755 [Verrucomicrobia bacterium S94]|nr:hypothetical protein EGM51_10755 [Verrucomicrobia bacterium S94]